MRITARSAISVLMYKLASLAWIGWDLENEGLGLGWIELCRLDIGKAAVLAIKLPGWRLTKWGEKIEEMESILAF